MSLTVPRPDRRPDQESTAAYLAARESQQSATEKIRQEAMQKAQKTAAGSSRWRNDEAGWKRPPPPNAKFKQAIFGSLIRTGRQGRASLGTFSRQWTRIKSMSSAASPDKTSSSRASTPSRTTASPWPRPRPAQAAIPQGPNRQVLLRVAPPARRAPKLR